MSNQTPRTDEWEAYCDECYYHMWRLRRKTERGWYDGFHIHTGEEAKGLCDLLNNLETELIAITKERDRLAEALRKAISWGDSASHHILHRQDMNWTYLNEAKEALQSLNQPEP